MCLFCTFLARRRQSDGFKLPFPNCDRVIQRKLSQNALLKLEQRSVNVVYFGQFVKYVTIKAFLSGIKFLLIKMYLVLT